MFKIKIKSTKAKIILNLLNYWITYTQTPHTKIRVKILFKYIFLELCHC